MSRRTTRSALLLGAVLVLAPTACSDSTGVTGDALTTQPNNQDLETIQKACWGKLGYEP